MLYNLKELKFNNDFAFIELENGNIVAFNIVDEELVSEDISADINAINIALVTSADNQIPCVNVIGLPNEAFLITTEYKEYLGKVLNKDNIKYCTMEVSND